MPGILPRVPSNIVALRLAEDVRQFGDAFTDLAIWMVTATGWLSVLCVPSR